MNFFRNILNRYRCFRRGHEWVYVGDGRDKCVCCDKQTRDHLSVWELTEERKAEILARVIREPGTSDRNLAIYAPFATHSHGAAPETVTLEEARSAYGEIVAQREPKFIFAQPDQEEFVL